MHRFLLLPLLLRVALVLSARVVGVAAIRESYLLPSVIPWARMGAVNSRTKPRGSGRVTHIVLMYSTAMVVLVTDITNLDCVSCWFFVYPSDSVCIKFNINRLKCTHGYKQNFWKDLSNICSPDCSLRAYSGTQHEYFTV